MAYKDDHLTKFQEDLSIAYLQAVCAKVGIELEIFKHDLHGTDGILKCYDTDDCEYHIHFQLKSTKNLFLSNDLKKFDIASDVHNKLCERKNRVTSLFVLEVHHNRDEWVTLNENEILIRHKMYFIDYDSQLKTNNANTVRIHIPLNNFISPDSFDLICYNMYKNWSDKKEVASL